MPEATKAPKPRRVKRFRIHDIEDGNTEILDTRVPVTLGCLRQAFAPSNCERSESSTTSKVNDSGLAWDPKDVESVRRLPTSTLDWYTHLYGSRDLEDQSGDQPKAEKDTQKAKKDPEQVEADAMKAEKDARKLETNPEKVEKDRKFSETPPQPPSAEQLQAKGAQTAKQPETKPRASQGKDKKESSANKERRRFEKATKKDVTKSKNVASRARSSTRSISPNSHHTKSTPASRKSSSSSEAPSLSMDGGDATGRTSKGRQQSSGINSDTFNVDFSEEARSFPNSKAKLFTRAPDSGAYIPSQATPMTYDIANKSPLEQPFVSPVVGTGSSTTEELSVDSAGVVNWATADSRRRSAPKSSAKDVNGKITKSPRRTVNEGKSAGKSRGDTSSKVKPKSAASSSTTEVIDHYPQWHTPLQSPGFDHGYHMSAAAWNAWAYGSTAMYGDWIDPGTHADPYTWSTEADRTYWHYEHAFVEPSQYDTLNPSDQNHQTSDMNDGGESHHQPTDTSQFDGALSAGEIRGEIVPTDAMLVPAKQSATAYAAEQAASVQGENVPTKALVRRARHAVEAYAKDPGAPPVRDIWAENGAKLSSEPQTAPEGPTLSESDEDSAASTAAVIARNWRKPPSDVDISELSSLVQGESMSSRGRAVRNRLRDSNVATLGRDEETQPRESGQEHFEGQHSKGYSRGRPPVRDFAISTKPRHESLLTVSKSREQSHRRGYRIVRRKEQATVRPEASRTPGATQGESERFSDREWARRSEDHVGARSRMETTITGPTSRQTPYGAPLALEIRKAENRRGSAVSEDTAKLVKTTTSGRTGTAMILLDRQELKMTDLSRSDRQVYRSVRETTTSQHHVRNISFSTKPIRSVVQITDNADYDPQNIITVEEWEESIPSTSESALKNGRKEAERMRKAHTSESNPTHRHVDRRLTFRYVHPPGEHLSKRNGEHLSELRKSDDLPPSFQSDRSEKGDAMPRSAFRSVSRTHTQELDAIVREGSRVATCRAVANQIARSSQHIKNVQIDQYADQSKYAGFYERILDQDGKAEHTSRKSQNFKGEYNSLYPSEEDDEKHVQPTPRSTSPMSDWIEASQIAACGSQTQSESSTRKMDATGNQQKTITSQYRYTAQRTTRIVGNNVMDLDQRSEEYRHSESKVQAIPKTEMPTSHDSLAATVESVSDPGSRA